METEKKTRQRKTASKDGEQIKMKSVEARNNFTKQEEEVLSSLLEPGDTPYQPVLDENGEVPEFDRAAEFFGVGEDEEPDDLPERRPGFLSSMLFAQPDPSSPKYYIRLVAILMAICVCVALMLAVVNKVTKDRIAENEVKAKQEAILDIFKDGSEVTPFELASGETVYIVKNGDTLLGYCVDAVGTGYVDEISMMIGIGTDHKVTGARIVSMSETPGVGSKTAAPSFLERFVGIDHAVTIGEDVDGITGASFSSRGVAQAVNYALSLNVDLDQYRKGSDITSPGPDKEETAEESVTETSREIGPVVESLTPGPEPADDRTEDPQDIETSRTEPGPDFTVPGETVGGETVLTPEETTETVVTPTESAAAVPEPNENVVEVQIPVETPSGNGTQTDDLTVEDAGAEQEMPVETEAPAETPEPTEPAENTPGTTETAGEEGNT